MREDVELRAIRAIMKALEDLDHLASSRVIGYVRSRLFGQHDNIFDVCVKSDIASEIEEEGDTCEG